MLHSFRVHKNILVFRMPAKPLPQTNTDTSNDNNNNNNNNDMSPETSHRLSEARAICLFNSVVATTAENGTVTGELPITTPIRIAPSTSKDAKQNDITTEKILFDTDSIHSLGSCRICRHSPSNMQVLKCPCHCKGSVGYIHLQCLKRWILQRGDNHCEICHTIFEIPDEKLNIKRMFKTFMCPRCCGSIIKHLLFSASLAPLAHIVLHQLLFCMDRINDTAAEVLTVKEVFFASCALLASSALFFHFFEFVTTRMMLIRNILRQWWMFGNSADFTIADIDSDYQMF